MSDPAPNPAPPPAPGSGSKPDAIKDVQAKSKEFLEKAKSGTLDEGALRWGLSAGAIVSGVSLLFNYLNYGDLGPFGSAKVTGLDLLSFRGGFSMDSLFVIAIPLSALFGLYLHFGEPTAKLLSLEAPGRAKLIHLIGMIAAAFGVIGCMKFLSHQVCLGSVLGLVGLAVLAFVHFKLWQISPPAPAEQPPVPPAS
ncbi:MAG: hypothetical protein L6R28_01940 [Planctomycetes bacterium]|nr:hypothetical protein [Planctomycetota bacterium]